LLILFYSEKSSPHQLFSPIDLFLLMYKQIVAIFPLNDQG